MKRKKVISIKKKKRKTASGRTPEPLKETARVRTRKPLKETARDSRTPDKSDRETFPSTSSIGSECGEKEEMTVLKEESTKRRGRGGRSGCQREKWCVEKQGKDKEEMEEEEQVEEVEEEGKIQEMEVVEEVPRIIPMFWCEEGRQAQRKECKRRNKEKTQATVDQVWEMNFSLADGCKKCANAASEEAQGRNESVTRMWQQMEVKERSWEEAFPKTLRRKRWSGQNRNAEGGGEGEVHLSEWIGVEHRKEVHEEIQRYL